MGIQYLIVCGKCISGISSPSWVSLNICCCFLVTLSEWGFSLVNFCMALSFTAWGLSSLCSKVPKFQFNGSSPVSNCRSLSTLSSSIYSNSSTLVKKLTKTLVQRQKMYLKCPFHFLGMCPHFAISRL